MHRPGRIALPLVALVLLLTAPAAFALTPAPTQPGFNGLQFGGRPVEHSSPVIADIDGNAGNGREVVIGASDGVVYAFSSSGAALWSYRTTTCTARPWNQGSDLIRGMPAVGDLDGDGRPEVVVGYGSVLPISAAGCQNGDTGGVVAINGESGGEQWKFRTPPDDMNGGILASVIGSVGLSDVDGNGTLEVGFGSTNNNIYLLDSNGAQIFRYRAFDTVWSSPAFADVNGDGRKELIIGADFGPGNCVPNTPTCRIPGAYGFVYAFPTAPGNLRREFGTGYLWRTTFDTVVNSSPAVADLDGDGTLEVVVGSGSESRDGGRARGRAVRVLDAATGVVEQTLAASGQVISAPALGDVNGDGTIDIVAAVACPNFPDSGCGNGRVAAWSGAGAKLWEVTPRDPFGNTIAFGELSNSPVIADLDGNGSNEVAVAVSNAVAVLRGADGAQLTSTCDACATPALSLGFIGISTPAVGDMDNDGELELAGAAATGVSGVGRLYVWDNFDSFLGSPAGNGRPDATPWANFRGTPSGGGALASGIQAPASLAAFLTVGTAQSFEFAVRANNGDAIVWRAAERDQSGIVSVSPTGGSGRLRVTITAPRTPGDYSATLTLSSDGLPDRVINIAVTSTAAEVQRLFLPVTGR